MIKSRLNSISWVDPDSGEERLVTVGDGVSFGCWTDRDPGTVVEIISPRRIVVQEDAWEVVSGSARDGSVEYAYRPNPEAPRLVVTLRKTKYGVRWMNGIYSFHIGRRRRYRDPSF